MDYQTITVWTVIKRFLLGWVMAAIFLVIVSCVKYKAFIITTIANNTWALINAGMPVLIIIFGIFYMIRTVFR